MNRKIGVFSVVLLVPVVFEASAINSKNAEPYQISRGDTLSKIAESLYGNWIKYKELWQINQDRIPDPNLIFPGQRLRLLEGGELELVAKSSTVPNESVEILNQTASRSGPLLAANSTVHGNNKGRIHRPSSRYRSEEWKLLPQQTWEQFTFRRVPDIDPDGFGKQTRIGVQYKSSLLLPAYVSSERLAVFGSITGGRSEHAFFGITEQVLIRADEELQVGKIYSIAEEPVKLSSGRDGRTGFFYQFSGKIKIVGVRDGVFVGTVIQASQPISRGMTLVQNFDSAALPIPLRAPSAIKAHLLESELQNAMNYGDYRIVFMDVGTDDGVKPGMVFRRYQHLDPVNKKVLSSRDLLVEAEIIVLKADAKFSAALVLNARSPLQREDEMVALVDLVGLGRHLGLESSLQDKPNLSIQDLDSMGATPELGEQEGQDLQQLENETSGLPSNEVRLEEINSRSRRAVPPGDERGPNDGSGRPSSEATTTIAPTPPPSTAEAPPSEIEPPSDESQKQVPTEVPDSTGPLEEAPQGESATTSGSSSGLSDPFSTDSFQEEPPAVPSPSPASGDPLLEAIPEPTPQP